MSNLATAYQAVGTFTLTGINSLAAGQYVLSSQVNFSGLTPIPLDVLIKVKIKTGTLGTNNNVQVYWVESLDGSTLTDGLGTSATTGATLPPNAVLLGSVLVSSSSAIYVSRSWSVASYFGGTLPNYGSLLIYNNTGGALDGSAGGSAQYEPIYATST